MWNPLTITTVSFSCTIYFFWVYYCYNKCFGFYYCSYHYFCQIRSIPVLVGIHHHCTVFCDYIVASRISSSRSPLFFFIRRVRDALFFLPSSTLYRIVKCETTVLIDYDFTIYTHYYYYYYYYYLILPLLLLLLLLLYLFKNIETRRNTTKVHAVIPILSLIHHN